jgi:hypothetical protein
MIRTAQRRFAPTAIGITRNSDRHQFGMSDRLRRNPHPGSVLFFPNQLVPRQSGRDTWCCNNAFLRWGETGEMGNFQLAVTVAGGSQVIDATTLIRNHTFGTGTK